MALRNGPGTQDKSQERLRGPNPIGGDRATRLNQEADNLRGRLTSVEDQQRALQNNRPFREAQEHFESQISMLETDKVSLMKRLNMVLSELEKATHEKAEINQKVLEQERMADDLKKKLEEVSSLKNVVNRNLQEDLRYERDLNDKLKEELTRFEREKESLLNKLKEQEALTQEIQRETSAIQANLQRKSDELRRLERDHESNLNRLRDLNQMLDGLRSQELHSTHEKQRMEEELDHLTRERNDLITRMNQLSDRYEDYVSTMHRERIQILQANKNHVKLLTSKLLFQLLEVKVLSRRKESFQEIKACSSHITKMEQKMHTFGRVLLNYATERKRHFLRLWYRKSMNVIHENYKKLNLVDYNVKKARQIKFFYSWRQAYLRRQKDYESKVDGLKQLRIILQKRQDLSLRSSLCHWRDLVETRQYQHSFLHSLLCRNRKRNLRISFVKWLAVAKKDQLDERYENMSELVTNLWFKQRVFLALRQAALESKTEKSMLKFRQWRETVVQARKKKYFQRKKGLISRLQGIRAERLLKRCFDAIRFGNLQQRYESTKEKLEQEIPVREELERKRDTLIKTNRTRDKYNLFRQCMIRHADLKYRALMVWKENVQYWNRTMQRTKLRLIELHKRNLSHAFFKWKESIDKKHMVELVSFTEDLVNENQELKNTLEHCHREQEVLADCTSRQQGLKLVRLRNMLNRNLMRRKYEHWAEYAFKVTSIEDAVWKSSKTIMRRKLRNAFNKYRKQVQQEKRLAYIKNKVDWFGNVRDRKTLENCIDAWKAYISRYQRAKTFLMRSIRGVDKLISNEAFSLWKRTLYDARRQVYHVNIEELGRRKRDHEQQLKDLDHQIQVNESTQKHLETKLQSQSHKIMANFISRFIHSSQARGFYTWVDVVKDSKTKKRFLKSTLLYWIKNAQAKGFRTWSEYTLKHKEHELANKLQQKELQRRQLTEQKALEELQQSQEVERLQSDLNSAVQLKDQLEVNFNKALDTHISRIQNNVYIDKRRNLLYHWADIARKQKNARNVICAIVRKQLRQEVFQRIRLVARERFLEASAMRALNNFQRIFKTSLVRRAFGSWRVKVYGCVKSDMEAKQQELALTQQRNAQELQQMQTQKHLKAARILKLRRQREIANAWIQQAKSLKQLRIKQETLQQNLRYLQISQATRKWHTRTNRTLLLRRRDAQVVAKYRQKMLQKMVQAWQVQKNISHLLGARVKKFVRRMNFLSLADGFSQVVHFSKSFQARIQERKMHGNQSIFKILSRMLKNRKAETFLSLKTRAYKKDFKERYLQRMLTHAYNFRMKHFFGRWRHNSDRLRLAETVNTEGDVVLERNELRRNVLALEKFLGEQGYTPEDIQKFVQRKGEQQRGNMHRAIVALFFKNSEFQIMPKAMNQWKRWVQQRKLYKQWSQYTVNALNHPLFWAFRQWKCQDLDSRDKLKGVLKRDLVQKIIQDDLAIGSAQSRLVRMDDAIENLNIQRDSLLKHYISGQKLAIALGKNNHLRTMFRAFIKWKKETKDQEQQLLNEQLDRTNHMIKDLMQHVGKLESINTNLQGENEELRQAALDGIEIAKAVQELTREREELSNDLQERANTIKKLIEDNNNLSLRLSIAQKEAEQLEQLNQQSYLQHPEKDRYY